MLPLEHLSHTECHTSPCFFLPRASSYLVLLFTVPPPALACRLSIFGCCEVTFARIFYKLHIDYSLSARACRLSIRGRCEVTPLRSTHSSHSLEFSTDFVYIIHYLLSHVASAFCFTICRHHINFSINCILQ